MRTTIPLFLAILAACNGGEKGVDTGTPPVATDTDSDSDTDAVTPPDTDVPPVNDQTCPPEVQSFSLPTCLETTVALGHDEFTPASGTLTGPIVESGAFVKDPAALFVPGFQACSGKDGISDMIRIQAEDGVIWTFGWGVDGDPDAATMFAAGETVTLEWTEAFATYGWDQAMIVRDGSGLRLAYDYGSALAPEALDGLVVTTGDVCLPADADQSTPWTVQRVFAGVALWPGERAEVIPPTGGPLQVVLPISSDCLEFCDAEAWMVWR